MRRMILAGLSAVAVALTVTACTAGPSAGSVEVTPDTIVLDVRTPGEYAGGHLEGAQLLDFNAGEVAAAIPTFDPEAEYVVYCRSGNRAGQAIKLMEQAGITRVTNLGSLEQAAAATGIEVVQ